MSRTRIVVLTALAMVAFAGNGLLCRIALKTTPIDPSTFTSARLVSGALVLAVLARIGRDGKPEGGSFASALALFAYAALYSFAYRSLTAATGALLLFAAVQVTMIGRGLWTGERLGARRAFGLLLALGGLVGLLLPGLTAPPLAGSALMIAAGFAWGVYSLRGRGAGDPTAVTAGNFLRSIPFALACSVATLGSARWDATGVVYAVLSGALTSGIGYAIWYTALPALAATNAAIVQLCVPVLVAAGGIVLLGEAMTLRFVLASIATLGGIALVILGRRARA
jgi:drug/metabolite transporter (DMT)-like permease